MVEKIVKYLGYAVFLIVTVMSIIYFVGKNQAPGLEQQLEEASNLDSIQKQAAVGDIATNWGGGVLNLAIVLFVLAAGLIIVFALVKFVLKLIDEPKSAIKSAVVFVLIGAIIVLAYMLASDAIPNFIGVEKFNVTAKMSKLVGTGLFITYIFFAMAFFGAIYTEISKIWK